MPPLYGSSMLRNTISGISICCWFLILFVPALSARQAPSLIHSPHLVNGGYGVLWGNTHLYSKNLHQQFVPASSIKIFTALLAIETLGTDFSCQTTFYIDDKKNLTIQGGGDPFLTSESIAEIAGRLRYSGITTVTDIILDDSLFAVPQPVPGSENSENPYDAPCSALAVNFNALPFTVLKNGNVRSSEQQTPTLPMMKDFALQKKPGNYRINVSAKKETGNISNILRYTGELFKAFLEREGITVLGNIIQGKAAADAKVVFIYTSQKTLDDILRAMLHFSNNFIANQLFLLCGLEQFGAPATWKKARITAENFINASALQSNEIHIEEGSGLSRKNRISPYNMLHILTLFQKYKHLLTTKNAVLRKSGTLTGVYSYAGYFSIRDWDIPFALFLNQQKNTRKILLHQLQQDVEYYMNRQSPDQMLPQK